MLITASPHITGRETTRGLMGNVIAALVPCIVAAALIFGWQALLLVGRDHRRLRGL